MTKIQLDIPEELNIKIGIEKLKRRQYTKAETIISILQEALREKGAY